MFKTSSALNHDRVKNTYKVLVELDYPDQADALARTADTAPHTALNTFVASWASGFCCSGSIPHYHAIRIMEAATK